METLQRQQADRELINGLIDHLASDAPEATLHIPAHSSVDNWLRCYRKAQNEPWRKQQLAWIIDPDSQGLPLLSPGQILRFYGYPQPRTPAERGVLLDALRTRQGFADTPGTPKLHSAFEQLHQDTQTLARELRALVSHHDLADDPFNLLALYRTRCRLTSNSFWARAMGQAATLLQALIEHPRLIALAPSSDVYTFDPIAGTLSGTSIEISHAQLLALPPQARFDELMAVAGRLQTFIHQDGRFSLAQLLHLHQLPLPASREDAWDVIEQLQQAEPLAVPPACDFANSDVALLHYDQPVTAHAKPRWGNYWETLGLPKPSALTLSAQQRTAVREVVAAFLPDSINGLLTTLLGPLEPTEPDESLHQLLNSPRAQALADCLIRAVGWYGHAPDEPTNRASRDALVLGALILSLDPHAGEVRYRVAGLDLNHSDFWGRDYVELRQAVELHLIDRGVATARTTALAAHLLLAGVAPECVVRDIPASLYFMSSYAWMIFKQGVLQAEALASGAARHMTFIEVMTLATQEAAADEQLWYEHCATASLIDWGVARNLLHPAPEGPAYSLAAIEALKQQLAPRMQALRSASQQLTTALVTRRALALADLQRVFPNHPLLEKQCLRWVKGVGKAPPFRRAHPSPQSLVDLHISGDLTPIRPEWHSTDRQLDLARLKPGFKYLNNIIAQFNHAAEAYVTRLKSAYTHAIQYLLSQLPLADRQLLLHGELQLWVLRQPAKVPLDQESVVDKMARTGRYGVLLRCEQRPVVTYYELFPMLNHVRKNPRLPISLQAGGQPLSFNTGSPTSTHPRSQLYIGSRLAIDWSAYVKGSPPKTEQWATVITDPLPVDIPQASDAAFDFDAPRCQAIAQAITRQHLFLDIDALLVQARGSNILEDQQRINDALIRNLLNLVPFWSCVQDLRSGDTRQAIEGAWSCFFDVLGVFAPTQVFASRTLSTLGKTLPASRKLLQLASLSARYVNATFNPLDGLPSLVRLGVHGGVRLSKAGRHLMDTALGHARQRLAKGSGLDYSRLLERADVDNARLFHAETVTHLPVIHRPAAWYGFDPFSSRPYGPPLGDLRLDSALVTHPMRSVDGYQARVVKRLFETPPLIIPRADATDLLERNHLWRLAPRNPAQLNDITSAAYIRLSDALESTCPLGRAKRSPVPIVCFSKKLYPFLGSIHKRRVQALDHIRLIPGPVIGGANRRLVLHRRVYEVVVTLSDFELRPLRPRTPLTYKQQVSAQRIDNEPQFGLPGDKLDNLLNRQTQVVRLAGIHDGIDDSRTLRAAVITLPGSPNGTQWVVEADTGVFYATTATPTGPLHLRQLDYSLDGEDRALIRAFCDWRNQHLNAGGLIPDQPLVALPTLETLYRQLTRRGFDAARLARLRTQASRLSVLKQRELLLNASDQGRRLDIQVVNRPIQLDIWPPRPNVPGGANAQQINRYLAERARESTLAVVEKTGVGSANTLGLGPAEMQRWRVAEPVVMWEYSKMGHPNYTEVILKTGAGNCDQMAHIACELIRTNGGTASVWGTRPAGHAFVVVGTPPPGLVQTINFGEVGWDDVWISDPWSTVTSAAADYIHALNIKMIEWDLLDISVFFKSAGAYRWARANDPAWLARLTLSDKLPIP